MTEAEKYFKSFFPTALIDDRHNRSMAQLSPDSVMEYAEQHAAEQVKKALVDNAHKEWTEGFVDGKKKALEEVEKSLPSDEVVFDDVEMKSEQFYYNRGRVDQRNKTQKIINKLKV